MAKWEDFIHGRIPNTQLYLHCDFCEKHATQMLYLDGKSVFLCDRHSLWLARDLLEGMTRIEGNKRVGELLDANKLDAPLPAGR